jgi:hypothetical protein
VPVIIGFTIGLRSVCGMQLQTPTPLQVPPAFHPPADFAGNPGGDWLPELVLAIKFYYVTARIMPWRGTTRV